MLILVAAQQPRHRQCHRTRFSTSLGLPLRVWVQRIRAQTWNETGPTVLQLLWTPWSLPSIGPWNWATMLQSHQAEYPSTRSHQHHQPIPNRPERTWLSAQSSFFAFLCPAWHGPYRGCWRKLIGWSHLIDCHSDGCRPCRSCHVTGLEDLHKTTGISGHLPENPEQFLLGKASTTGATPWGHRHGKHLEIRRQQAWAADMSHRNLMSSQERHWVMFLSIQRQEDRGNCSWTFEEMSI